MRSQRTFQAAVTFVLVACAITARAQDPSAAKLPEFEVATVRPVLLGVPHSMGIKIYPGGRLVIRALTLQALVGAAFGLPFWQISGGEAWIRKDEFDIEARPSESGRATVRDLRHTLFTIEDARLREMLQSLLRDRFHLTFHRESKAGDVYLLERSGKQVRLAASAPAPESTDNSEVRGSFGSIGYVGGRWSMFATTMPQLAWFASSFELHAPVTDRSGLTGAFDFRQHDPDEEPNYADNADSFVRWLSDAGLRFARGKGTVEMFVIDGAVRPSAN